MHTKKSLNPPRYTSGFSLVEVTMALGIVSFALVSSMGLICVGLGLFRHAIDNSIQSTITQRVMGSIKQTDFSRLASLDTTKYYFDDQGNEITSTNDIANKNYLYQAGLTVLSPTQLPINTSDPNLSGTTTSSTNLATVAITITTLSNPASPFKLSMVVSSNGS